MSYSIYPKPKEEMTDLELIDLFIDNAEACLRPGKDQNSSKADREDRPVRL